MLKITTQVTGSGLYPYQLYSLSPIPFSNPTATGFTLRTSLNIPSPYGQQPPSNTSTTTVTPPSTTTSTITSTSTSTITPPPSNAIVPPLSTSGSKIIDSTGKQVLLRGLNWFGFETGTYVVHDLGVRDYISYLNQIKELGHNIIRLPWSIESIYKPKIQTPLTPNSDLKDLSPLEAMDKIIDYAATLGILILLDCHRCNSIEQDELWYGNGYSEQDWLAAWSLMANRYRNKTNVVGADLKNEPHGRCTWGDNSIYDWRNAAIRCGNLIQSLAPNWLIVVEGVEFGTKVNVNWWGSNLEKAGELPITLLIPNKVVYSPHEYATSVYDSTWLHEPNFPESLIPRWDIVWGYLVKQNIAPVLISEFGGKLMNSPETIEGKWAKTLVKYIADNQIHFTFWCLNPNSRDTGGILNDDWTTVDQNKQGLLQPLLGK